MAVVFCPRVGARVSMRRSRAAATLHFVGHGCAQRGRSGGAGGVLGAKKKGKNPKIETGARRLLSLHWFTKSTK